MADYRLLITASASKELGAVEIRRDRQRIVVCIRALARESRPAGCQKLTSKEQCRVRQGRYRVVYEIDEADCSITIVKIGHRDSVHR